MPAGPAPRGFPLDLLRAIAILGVVMAHGTDVFDNVWSPAWPGWRFLVLGAAGVDLFFVLSGFLVGRIAIAEAMRSGPTWRLLGRFWIRRWWRTLPTFHLFVAVNAILAATSVRPAPFDPLVPLLAHNLVDLERRAFMPEAWSLATEEWFYLALPVVLALALLWHGLVRTASLTAALALIAVPLALRTLHLASEAPAGYTSFAHSGHYSVLYRLDSLGAGVLLAWLHTFERERFARGRQAALRVGAAGAVAGLALYARLVDLAPPDAWHSPWSLAAVHLVAPVMTLGMAGLVWSAAASSHGGGRARPIVTEVALVSYSWYLVHLPVHHVLRAVPWTRLGHWLVTDVLVYLIYLASSFALARFVYWRFERPVTALRERFAPRLPEHARHAQATPM